MPLYEFRCAGCRHTFEVRTPTMAVPEDLSCPECGGTEVHRMLSSFFAHSGQKAHSAPVPEQCQSCPGSGGAGCPFSR